MKALAPRSHAWRALACAAIAATCASTNLAAQAAPSRDSIQPAPFMVPESPAFRFLGVSPTSVDRPTTPQKLAASLTNARDSTGAVKQGVAIGVAPAQYLYTVKWLTPNLTEYQNKSLTNWKYYVWNSSISAGTAAATNDTSSTDLSTGLRLVLWDQSDAMRDSAFTNAIQASNAKKCNPGGPTPDSTQLAALAHCLDTEYQNALKAWNDTGGGAWNHGGVAVAGALGWRAVGSQSDHIVPLGWSAWMSASEGLGSWGVFSMQLQRDSRNPLASKASVAERTYTLGERLIAGSGRANVFLDYAGEYFQSSDSLNKTWRSKWSGGVELKVRDKTWLETGFGNQVKTTAKPQHIYYFAGLKLQMFDTSIIRQ